MLDLSALRSEFPVLQRLVYMNAGTNGPVPRRGVDAVEEALRFELEHGRAGKQHFERLTAARDALRARVAGLIGCDAGEVALTGATTDGVNAVVAALGLRGSDEIVTTDEEHPGVLAPLAAAARRCGCRIRAVPWDELASSVGPDTRLVASSHVSWVSGRIVDSAALRDAGAPFLLDGAQGIGAIPVDVRALGCDFYAASGQKWLCGPDGSGYLYVRRERALELDSAWPGYLTLADTADPLAFDQHPNAARFDTGTSPSGGVEWATAAFDVLASAGFDQVHERGITLAARLAELLTERGADVAPRGASTLVSWHSDDPEGDVERLAADGIVVRNLPGRGLVRASVGAWATEEELDRLVTAAPAVAR
jgi:selenocysteine lyase/cysteine desulfurase